MRGQPTAHSSLLWREEEKGGKGEERETREEETEEGKEGEGNIYSKLISCSFLRLRNYLISNLNIIFTIKLHYIMTDNSR